MVSTPFIFTRREDVVSDCAAKQETARLQTIKPDHHHQLQLEQQEMRPTLRVEPLKREAGPTEDEKEDKEEKGKEGNPLLRHIPFLVLGLILIIMVLARSQQDVILLTLIGIVGAISYKYLTDQGPLSRLSSSSSQETSQ